MDWKPLNPEAFQQVTSEDGRQIAKDDKYMGAVQEVWKSTKPHEFSTEISSFVYHGEDETDDERTQLYGHVARRKQSSAGGMVLASALHFMRTTFQGFWISARVPQQE